MTEPGLGRPEGIARYSQEGARRSRLRRRKLVLEEVELALGALATVEDAQRWLRTIVVWGAAGLIPGTMANACASCVREWLKAHDMTRVAGRIRELERQIAQRDRERGHA